MPDSAAAGGGSCDGPFVLDEVASIKGLKRQDCMTEIPDAEDALSPPPGSTPSEMFPVLTSAQQARVLAHGQRRTVEQNEMVVELNQHVTKVFVAVGGQQIG